MRQSTVAPQPTEGRKPGRSSEASRLLLSMLRPTLLGERIPADFYARNGFRFLGVPASIDASELSMQFQQFRNLLHLDPTRTREHCIRTIRDGHLDAEAILAAVAKLENPSHRFVAELFWPHLPEDEFCEIRSGRELGSPALLQRFAPDGSTGATRALRVHFSALARHCIALQEECAFLEGGPPPPDGSWKSAIDAWRRLWATDEFWQYMRERVKALDDPRVHREDVDRARADLPHVVLGLQELLAGKYSAAEDYANCVRHLALIRTSGFPDDVVHAATWNAVKRVAGTRLEDLHGRARQTFESLADKVSRDKFEAVAGPILREAHDIRALLSERLMLTDDLLEQSTFDQLAQGILDAVNKKLDYQGDERERNILFSSRVGKRLLSLPLSGKVRRAVEQSLQDDNRILYSQFYTDPSGWPTSLECFFLPGAEADPDASIAISMYRITERKIEVDRIQRSAGLRLFWDRATLLVPRSTCAMAAGSSGTAEVEIPEAEYKPAQRAAAVQLKALRSELDAVQAEITKQRTAETRAEEQRQKAELRVVEEREAARVTEAEAALATANRNEAEQIKTEEQRLESENERMATAHEPGLEAARVRVAATRERLQRGTSFLLIEIPLALLGTLSLLLMRIGPYVVIVAGALVFAFLASSVIRRACGLLAAYPLHAAARALEREKAACLAESSSRRLAIQAEAAKVTGRWKSLLSSVESEKNAILEASRQRAEELTGRLDERAGRATAEFQQKERKLRSQLVRKAKVLKESQKGEFPAYRAARKKGFKEGSRPSSVEFEMTESEKAEARMRLSLSW
jgi:hypothetical protein